MLAKSGLTRCRSMGTIPVFFLIGCWPVWSKCDLFRDSLTHTEVKSLRAVSKKLLTEILLAAQFFIVLF